MSKLDQKNDWWKIFSKIINVWNCFDEINFKLLPEKFVLKANHGAAYDIIVEVKSKLIIIDVRNKMNKWIQKK